MTRPVKNPASEKPSTGSQVELFSRAAATALVVTYGLGFLILSLHEAKFGISQFNPLRTRILAVGFIFACLSALPAAAVHYGLSYYGGLERIVQTTDPRTAKYRKVVLACGFIFTAWLMAGFSSFLFVPSAASGHPWWFEAVPEAIAAIFFVVSYSVIAKRLSESPRSSLVLAILTALLVIVVFQFFGQESFATLTLWCFAVGLSALGVRESKNGLKEALDWRNWIWAAILVGLYASSIYGRIQPKYGGGAPTPTVVYLTKPLAWMDSNVVSALLLDESEEGYFILAPNADRALFIPRSNVAALYFGPLERVPKRK